MPQLQSTGTAEKCRRDGSKVAQDVRVCVRTLLCSSAQSRRDGKKVAQDASTGKRRSGAVPKGRAKTARHRPAEPRPSLRDWSVLFEHTQDFVMGYFLPVPSGLCAATKQSSHADSSVLGTCHQKNDKSRRDGRRLPRMIILRPTAWPSGKSTGYPGCWKEFIHFIREAGGL